MASVVLIRAAISQDEWRDYRKLALDKRVPVSELTARLIRRELRRAQRRSS